MGNVKIVGSCEKKHNNRKKRKQRGQYYIGNVSYQNQKMSLKAVWNKKSGIGSTMIIGNNAL